MISLRKTQVTPGLRDVQTRQSSRETAQRRSSNSTVVTKGVTPFTLNVSASDAPIDSTRTTTQRDTPPNPQIITVPGTIDLGQFTDAGIDRRAALAYSEIAKANNQHIDLIYNQAKDNWILNGRRGPEPAKPAYHESDPEKIFKHLQGFRYGGVAIPDDGSGYLSVDGYVSSSPNQQQFGKTPEQLTAFNGNGYQQVKTPVNPATPLTSAISWGPATESMKPKA